MTDEAEFGTYIGSITTHLVQQQQSKEERQSDETLLNDILKAGNLTKEDVVYFALEGPFWVATLPNNPAAEEKAKGNDLRVVKVADGIKIYLPATWSLKRLIHTKPFAFVVGSAIVGLCSAAWLSWALYGYDNPESVLRQSFAPIFANIF